MPKRSRNGNSNKGSKRHRKGNNNLYPSDNNLTRDIFNIPKNLNDRLETHHKHYIMETPFEDHSVREREFPKMLSKKKPSRERSKNPQSTGLSEQQRWEVYMNKRSDTIEKGMINEYGMYQPTRGIFFGSTFNPLVNKMRIIDKLGVQAGLRETGKGGASRKKPKTRKTRKKRKTRKRKQKIEKRKQTKKSHYIP